MLLNVPNGLTPTMRYTQYKRAKIFAKEHDLPFNKDKELNQAARELLDLALAYQLGNGCFR